MSQENQPDAITIVRGRGRGAEWVRFDDHGITFRTLPGASPISPIGWDEVLWFRDGRSAGWALAIELHDGGAVTAEATSNRKAIARPETLTAIRNAAERYAVPAVLTGTPASSGPPGEPGLYTDPGGKLGLRQWSGTEWSPFLQVDRPAADQEGGRGQYECDRLFPRRSSRCNGSMPLPAPAGQGSSSSARSSRRLAP